MTTDDPLSQPFYPTLYDVFKVRYILQWKIVSEALPAEIVDLILDAAEYWPSVESIMDKKTIIRQDQDRVLLKTVPLCYDPKTLENQSPKVFPHRTIHPCRKIIFSVSSHDQGWGGGHKRSPFDGSFTWFDTEVIHFVPQQPSSDSADTQSTPENTEQGVNRNRHGAGTLHFLPTTHKLQLNRTAVGVSQRHLITWHYLDSIKADSAEAEEIGRSQGQGEATLDGSLVRTLDIGDSIAVWGRARFPGWANHVERISVRVFWAV